MSDHPEFVKRIVGHNLISFDDGKFIMGGVLGMPVPMNSLVLLYKLTTGIDKKRNKDILFQVGKIQCYGALEFYIAKFGYKTKKESIEMVRQQVALIGYGNLEFQAVDVEKRVMFLKNTNTPFASLYRRVCGVQKEAIDEFLRGICAGLFEEIIKQETGKEEDMVAIEKSCIAKGDSCCTFEVRPRSNWNLDDPLVKEQMPTTEFDNEELRRISNVKTFLA